MCSGASCAVLLGMMVLLYCQTLSQVDGNGGGVKKNEPTRIQQPLTIRNLIKLMWRGAVRVKDDSLINKNLGYTPLKEQMSGRARESCKGFPGRKVRISSN